MKCNYWHLIDRLHPNSNYRFMTIFSTTVTVYYRHVAIYSQVTAPWSRLQNNPFCFFEIDHVKEQLRKKSYCMKHLFEAVRGWIDNQRTFSNQIAKILLSKMWCTKESSFCNMLWVWRRDALTECNLQLWVHLCHCVVLTIASKCLLPDKLGCLPCNPQNRTSTVPNTITVKAFLKQNSILKFFR